MISKINREYFLENLDVHDQVEVELVGSPAAKAIVVASGVVDSLKK